jgi:hypothetical protein
MNRRWQSKFAVLLAVLPSELVTSNVRVTVVMRRNRIWEEKAAFEGILQPSLLQEVQ